MEKLPRTYFSKRFSRKELPSLFTQDVLVADADKNRPDPHAVRRS
jgi:hypothetical protein